MADYLGAYLPDRIIEKADIMKLSFHGANRTVTGSKHLIEVNGTRILLDCGLFQGRRSETYERNQNFTFDPKTVDVVVLSHAHIDHSGNLPNLVKYGFKGDIVATPATRDLCAMMLPDSGHIQERDAEFVNKRRRKHGEEPVDPLYTQEDAREAMSYFVTRSYHRPYKIAPGVQVTFIDAGHMLGSASVILDIQDQETKRDMRLVFSGDIGRKGIPIIRDPEIPDAADVLIMESTYGSRLHEDFDDSEKRLEQIVTETYKRGGSLIMPAFAVGRVQQIVYTLHRLVQRGDIPRIPIFVDSPLAVNVTSVFSLHPECYDSEISEFVAQIEHGDPFGFRDLTYIRSLEESKQLNFRREPCVIVAASGMMEFGRILHHVRHRIEDPKNTVLITGWQAENTLGRKLIDGQKTVRIFGEDYHPQARIEVLDGFSGHADRDELLTWVEGIQRKPSRIFLVHGEEPEALALKGVIEERFGIKTDVPSGGDEVQI